MKIQVVLIFLLVCYNSIYSQFNLNGRIIDCEGDPIPFAQIHDSTNDINTKATINGYFVLKNTDTNSIIHIKCLGFQKNRVVVQSYDTLVVKMIKNPANNKHENILAKKPIIYLYPENKTDVTIKVNFNGKFNFTYPQYNEGWNIIAFPDGSLINKIDKKTYSYLFWEGEMNVKTRESSYENGFIIHRDSTVLFFQNILFKIGLKSKEIDDFIVFWTPYLLKNEWNFINFKVGNDYNVVSTNIINPKPDTEIRVFMSFKKTVENFSAKPQEFKTPIRKGFTVVEWGGAELTN